MDPAERVILALRVTDPVVGHQNAGQTGTLNDVISLSGYVLGPNNGQVLAFSVIINGARGQQHQARTLSDDLVRAMASFLYPR